MRAFVLLVSMLVWPLAALPAAGEVPAGAKVLRYAIESDATTLDPSGLSDIYSNEVAGSIFEPLYRFDYLARPVRVRPQLAASLPEASADQREFIVRLRPGIRFSADPAFGNVPREIVAQDVVYGIKRIFDPRWKSSQYPDFAAIGIKGLDEVRRRAIDGKQPFDYNQPIDGLVALDAHTVRFRLDRPNPRFVFELTATVAPTAVAREVVERYGDAIGEHPVGSGPFVLASWQRGSKIVLARNPDYRDERYDEQATPGDALAESIARTLHGRRLPMVDRVEISIIEEDQPRWLAFLSGDHDLAALPGPYVPSAFPHGHVAPGLARQGIHAQSGTRPDVVYTVFNMEDPVIGGYTPAQVALRRAIGLGYDNEEEIRTLRRGLGLAAQSVVPPYTYGYEPGLKTEMSEFDPARANALLDLYGFTDRDGNGWRDRPDGSPLVLEFHTSASLRPFNELWERRMRALHLKIRFVSGLWQEQAKSARAGKLMIWFLSWNATLPDAEPFLRLGYGPATGGDNLSRFNLPAYNDLFERQSMLPDGPDRLALIEQANRLLLAYMPLKAHVHRVGVTMIGPRVTGYLRHPFMRSFHTYVDVTPLAQ